MPTREETIEADKKIALDKIQKIHDDLVTELAKHGGHRGEGAEAFDPDHWTPSDYFHFDKDAAGPKVSVQVKYSAERSGFGSYRDCNGKVRVKVGDYGSMRQFPDRKQGPNIPGMVAAVLETAAKEKAIRVARGKREKAEDAAYARAEAINKRCGVAYVTGYADNIRPDGAHAVVKDCRIELDHGDLTEAEVELVLAYIVTIKKKCPGC